MTLVLRWAAILMASGGLSLVCSVRAQVDELSTWGPALFQWAEAYPQGALRSMLLNEAELIVTTGESPRSALELREAFTTRCPSMRQRDHWALQAFSFELRSEELRSEKGALASPENARPASLDSVAQESSDVTPPVAYRAWTGLIDRVAQGGSEADGFFALCVDPDVYGSTGAFFKRALQKPQVPRFVYLIARSQDSGSRYAMVATEVAIDLKRLLPQEGDAPGLDFAPSLRPAATRRVLSISEAEGDSSLAVYQGPVSLPQYLARVQRLGWFGTEQATTGSAGGSTEGSAKESLLLTRSSEFEGSDAVVFVHQVAGSHSYTTLVRLQ